MGQAMERGLRAPLSPHEEVSFRRVALGISKAELLPVRDVERLKALSLIEEHESHLRLTPTGRKRYQALPNITAVQQPENRMRPSRNWPLSLQGHAASEGWLPMTDHASPLGARLARGWPQRKGPLGIRSVPSDLEAGRGQSRRQRRKPGR